MTDWLPDWAQGAVAWVAQPAVLGVLVGGSVLLFAASLVALPLLVVRLPADFFTRPAPPALALRGGPPLWQVLLVALKNALGVVLLLLGLAMLVLPGQGLLTLLAGLVLVDFPGKRRLERWVITRPAVHRTIDALRRRAGRPPLELPPPG